MSDIDQKLLFKAIDGKFPDNTVKNKKRKTIEGVRDDNFRRLLDLESIKAERSKRSFKQFVINSWPIVEQNSPFIDNWHIDAVCEHLEAVVAGEIRNLIINVPPRSSKSYLCSVMFPCWLWLRQPHIRFICASHSHDLTFNLARKCLVILNSRWYRRHFSDLYKITSSAVREIRNNHLGVRLATSPGSPITGRGGHYIIGDDILDAGAANSEETRKGVNNWYSESLSNRIEGLIELAHKIIIMQRLHDEDLTGYLLNQGGWEHLMIPMEYDPKRHCTTSIGWSDPRNKPGELLDPIRFPQNIIDKWKGENKSGQNPDLSQEYSTYIWAGQFQQNPIPAGGGLVKSEWLEKSFYSDDPREIYVKANKVIQSWDLGFKETTTSDFVVGQVWAKIGPDLYLLHQVRARMDIIKTINAIHSLTRDFPRTQEKLIEDKANGPAVVDSLKKKIQGIIPVPVSPGDSKEGRLVSVLWLLEAGNVHLPNPKKFNFSWIEETIEEWVRFPLAPYDDTVDAMVHALRRLQDLKIDPYIVPLGVGSGNRFDKDWEPPNTQYKRENIMSNWGVTRE